MQTIISQSNTSHRVGCGHRPIPGRTSTLCGMNFGTAFPVIETIDAASYRYCSAIEEHGDQIRSIALRERQGNKYATADSIAKEMGIPESMVRDAVGADWLLHWIDPNGARIGCMR